MPAMLSLVLSNITIFVVYEGNGVKGIADMGHQFLRKQYIQLPEERITTSIVIVDDSIPVIDLSDRGSDLNVREFPMRFWRRSRMRLTGWGSSGLLIMKFPLRF
nr:feruloyl CoA ortho-hydroxylase 1-like [Ipomoea batatas]